ncbi:MAG: Bug family tripartite tricarboxylate transporter substrate binding protein [Xanthobacteraceae bacterium]
MRLRIMAGAIGLALIALAPARSQAQSPADFFKGRNVELYIGYSVGGAYDLYARVLARHIGKHIPGGPTIIPRNMEGAGSLRLANWLYNVAAKDGTVMATIGRGTPFDPLLGSKAAQFDASKFTWIGSANNEVSICVSWKTSSLTKFDDLFTHELVIGGTGPAADTDQFPKILNGVLGTKFKIVAGYPGGNDVTMAMERGEVMGRCGWSWSSVVATHKRWVNDKSINILLQLSLHKHPELPDVPLAMDYAKTEEGQQIFKLIFARQVIGRPFIAPPGVPKDRADAMRKAFMDTMQDPEFLADAGKTQLEINPVAGEAVERLVREVHQFPKAVSAKAGQYIRQ